MARINDLILTSFSGLNSVALDADARQAAVCFNDRELHIYRIVADRQNSGQSQTSEPTAATDLEDGHLEESRFFRLEQGRYGRPDHAEVSYRHSRIAFFDEQTILVAR